MTRERLLKALGIAAIATGSLAALVTMAVWWVVSTEPGARWAFERLGAAFPGEIEIGRLSGPIRGPLEVRDFRYRSDRLDLSIDRLRLEWSLRALWNRRLDIRALEADSVRLSLGVTEEPPAAPDTLKPELPDFDLPLDVMVGRGRIVGLHLTPAGSDSALVFDQVTLSEVAFRDSLRVGSLSLRSPTLDLELQGGAYTRGRYAIDLGTRWTWHRPGDDLEGAGRVAGNLDTLRTDQLLTAPFPARAEVTAIQPLRDLHFAGVITFEDLETRRIDPSWPPARASGRLEVQGRPEAFTSTGTVDARTRDWGRLAADYALERVERGVELRQVTLTFPGRGGRLVTRGSILTIGKLPELDLRGSWQALSWPLAGAPVVTSEHGAFTFAGPLEDYRLTADATLETEQVPGSRWRLSGRGNTGEITLEDLDGRILGGTVRGSGAVDWTASVAWHARLAAEGLDPEAAWPQWPGRVGFDLSTAGRASAGAVSGEVALERVRGELRGRALDGRAAAALHSDGATIRSLELGWGPNRVTAEGAARQRWDLTWTVDAPDLSAVIREGAGSLDASGRLGGPRATPRIEATLEADSLRWSDRAADRLAGTVDLDLGGGASRADFEAIGLAFAGRIVDHAALRGSGRRAEHEVELTATAGEDSLRLAARGRMPGATWAGRFERLDLVSREFGSWALDTTAFVTAAPDQVGVESFCLVSSDGRLCADGGWHRAGTWNLDARLEQVRLRVLAPLLPAGLEVGSAMSGNVAARGGAGGRLEGHADLEIGAGEITYPTRGDDRGRTPLESATLRARAGDAGIETETRIALGPTGSIAVDLRMPRAAGAGGIAEDPIDGTVRVRLDRLDLAQAFLPELANTRGTFTADLRIAGSARRPRWIGTARLERGEADVPRLELELRDVTLTATSEADGRLVIDGGARSGPGRVSWHGAATFAEGGTPRAELGLTGERLEVAGTRDLRVLASPDLRVLMAGDSLHLSGELTIPEAEVRSRPRTVDVVTSSPDVVYVSADTAARAPRSRLAISSEVRLVLGREVRIDAVGLDARIEGSILVVERPGAPTTASGELRIVEGTYQAYGQDLRVERGRLLFAGGPIENPGLDIRAARHARDGVVAGFEVKGTLESPRLDLFSEPPMAEREALAYVVLGRPLDQASESESGIVTDAANKLGLRGGNYIAGTLARELGLDEAEIQSEGGLEDASLMLGTYLSPRVYVKYGLELTDPLSTLRIQYFLNSKWTLEAETGTENKGSILYTVER